jgi:hypothetical protein
MPTTIHEILDNVRIIDVHEHLSPRVDIITENTPLASILRRSYVGFFDFYPGLKPEFRQFEPYEDFLDTSYSGVSAFLQGFNLNDFLPAIEAGIAAMYGVQLSELKEWDFGLVEEAIRTNYDNPNNVYRQQFHKFNVEKVILDVPHHLLGLGDINDDFHKNLFHEVLRINSLLFGFDLDAWTESTSLMRVAKDDLGIIEEYPSDLDGYLDAVDTILAWAKERVAGYKCASAYERTIDFGGKASVDTEGEKYGLARDIFGKSFSETTEKERLAFGDVVFHHILGEIESQNKPLQMHVGTAIQSGSNPLNLEPVLAGYPNVRFSLMHGGYPWIDETLSLVKAYDNVRAEMTWLQTISREAAARFLDKAIDAGVERKIMAYGGDCGCIEGSIGALITIKNIVAASLDRRVQEGSLSLRDSDDIATALFYQNANDTFFRGK